MTLNEAFDILGVSRNASGPMLRAAMKARLEEAGTKLEERLIKQAYLVATGTQSAEPDKPPPPAAPSSKSAVVVKKTSVVVHTRTARPTDSKKATPSIKLDFESPPHLFPSRIFRAKESFSNWIQGKNGPSLRNWSVCTLPGNRHFLSAGESGCYKWEISTGKVVARLRAQGGDLFSVRTNQSGSLALTTGISQTVSLIDVASGKQLSTFSGHGYWSRDAIFLPGDNEFLSVGWDGNLLIHDISAATNKTLCSVSISGHSNSRAALHSIHGLTKDGHAIVCANGGHVFSIPTDRYQHVEIPDSYLADSRRYTTAGFNKDHEIAIHPIRHRDHVELAVFDTNQKTKSKSINLKDFDVRHIAISPTGRQFVTLGDHGIYIWSTDTMAPNTRLLASDKHSTFESASFSEDGSSLFVTGSDPAIYMWRF
ncbi:WD40 repeat domain-containing protein [Albimonas pacifica]|uniref:WD40 repeat n=1 Tax=Albimonas pacifica TaxID=1114924 RepID=A0A1I3PZS3_9RHOB|nr:WD40 repeat domain-containing protein [Albimonas pacifica]SFJ26925.1 hypothetical protein SAMN05216258_1235 [Albimonas pacifica]